MTLIVLSAFGDSESTQPAVPHVHLTLRLCPTVDRSGQTAIYGKPLSAWDVVASDVVLNELADRRIQIE